MNERLRDLLENYKEYFFDLLVDYIQEVKEDNKIKYLDYNLRSTLKEEISELDRLDKVHSGIKEFYTDYAGSGFLEWYKDKNSGVGGHIKFIDMKSFLGDDLSKFYDDELIEENEDIRYFRPWDYATPEAQCGFVIKPDVIYPSVYYNQAGRSSLHSLDLDYHGYTEMALEARVFYQWQVVLLHHNGWHLGAVETEIFKKEMPEIFPDFSWDKFIERYESLRLSKK